MDRLDFEHDLEMGYFADYISPINDALKEMSKKAFSECLNDRFLAEALVEDGVYIDFNEYRKSVYKDKVFVVDTLSGISFWLMKDGVYVDTVKSLITASEHSIQEAFIFKSNILVALGEYQRISSSGINTNKGTMLRSQFLLDAPIVDFTVENRQELMRTIDFVTKICNKSNYITKIWYRGQNREYSVKRNQMVNDYLGFHKSYSCMPSLKPSLGRIAENHEKFEKAKYDSYLWEYAFHLWIISNYKYFQKICPKEYQEIMSLSKNLLDIESYLIKMGRQGISYEEDDIYSLLRGHIPQVRRYAMPLIMQQYGLPTNVLDITDDIDVALFFTHSRLNSTTNKYEIIKPTDERIIYVLGEVRNNSTINRSSEFFNVPVEWECPMPKRIINQNCGLLFGADWYNVNTYGYRIVAKIYLQSDDLVSLKTVDDMFPNEKEDEFYGFLKSVYPQLSGLYG